jgi:hypothetical protein
MISSRLQGGLGNQMFQIAAAYAAAKRIGDDYGFDFSECHTPQQGNTSRKYANNIFKNVKQNKFDANNFKHLDAEPKFSYTPITPSQNVLLYGFYQSEKYFSDYKNDIINLFDIKPIPFVKSEKLTAIHVRRGDYLKLPNYHPTCSVEYYTKAMEIIGEGDFIFISDDIEWCKENFKGDNIMYSPFDNEIDDLSLIAICDNVIMSNSSFSWWGAYLNRNKGKKVIAPKVWFGPDGPQDQNDIIPESWIKI